MAPTPLGRGSDLSSPRLGGLDRVAGIATRNAFPIVVAALVSVVLTLLCPWLFVADSWMTLVAGREIVQHGIPHHETLTAWAAGRTWTDQQWLAQLFWYGVDGVAGLRGVALVGVLLVVATVASAMTAARLLGATARSTFIVSFVAIFAAPWSWQIRAQTLALPLFVWAIWLAADHVRRPSRRILVSLPLLVVWANLHGSVLVGATVVALSALVVGFRSRTRRSIGLGFGLAAGASFCALLTPYGTGILSYYRLMLIHPPFAQAIQEWERTTPGALTAVFFVLAVATALLGIWQRHKLTAFDGLVLALTLVGAIQAIRGIVWFVLAVAVFLPSALDGAIKKPDEVKLPRANRILALVAVGSAATVFVIVAARPQSWFEHVWPTEALTAVEQAGPNARLLASDRHADWLLWRIPGLRGRLAYDVRFELYTRAQIVALSRYDYRRGRDWRTIAKGYDVFVVDEQNGGSLTTGLLKEPGTLAVYRDSKIAVVTGPR